MTEPMRPTTTATTNQTTRRTRAVRACRLAAVVAAVALAVLSAPLAEARPGQVAPRGGGPTRSDEVPPEMAGIEIEPKIGAFVPRDVMLRDQDDQPVSLATYLGDGKPVVLVLAYYECPMLCSMVLNGALESLKKVPYTAGTDYRVVVVSIDPRDKPAVAKAKRAGYAEAYGRAIAPRGFDFLVGDGGSTRKLADAVGFRYRWDGAAGQYSHAAGIFVLTPDGRVSRILFGIRYEPRDVRLALVEASQGKLGSVGERLLLYCLHYDPNSRGYTVATVRLLKASAFLTVAILGLWLVRSWRNERRRTPPPPEHTT